MLETIISWVLPVIFTSCLGYIIKELKSNHQNNISKKRTNQIGMRLANFNCNKLLFNKAFKERK